MDCDEIKTYFNVYLDEEFAAEESAEFDAHLKQCKECQNLLASEKCFRESMKEKLELIKAPPELKEVILLKLDSMKEPLSSFKNLLFFRILPITATICVILAIFVYFSYFSKKKSFLDYAIESHEENINNEIYGTKEEIEEFLRKKSPFPVKIPIPQNSEMKLVGTKITKVNSLPAILFIYNYKNHRISLIQCPHKEDNELIISIKNNSNAENGIYLEKNGRYSVANFKIGGIYHSMVGDLEGKELLSIIPASF